MASLVLEKSDWSALNVADRGFIQSPFKFWGLLGLSVLFLGSPWDGHVKLISDQLLIYIRNDTFPSWSFRCHTVPTLNGNSESVGNVSFCSIKAWTHCVFFQLLNKSPSLPSTWLVPFLLLLGTNCSPVSSGGGGVDASVDSTNRLLFFPLERKQTHGCRWPGLNSLRPHPVRKVLILWLTVSVQQKEGELNRSHIFRVTC